MTTLKNQLVFMPLDALGSPGERDAIARLTRVHGPGGLRAALLAMLVGPAQPGRLRVWADETSLIAEADGLREDVDRLGPASRLPCFELLLARQAKAPLAERQELLHVVRRLLVAARKSRPLERLMWLAMRRSFGETPWAVAHVPADVELDQLPPLERLHIAHFTAHLARMVPADDDAGRAGQAWYAQVLDRWFEAGTLPRWQRPDVDAVVHALQSLQALSWMQRPLLVRAWISEALPPGKPGPLPPAAADALRLSCLLLDCPLPPELARQYVQVGGE